MVVIAAMIDVYLTYLILTSSVWTQQKKKTLTQLQASLLERTLSAKQANLIRDTSISSNLVMNDDPCSN